MLLHYFQFKKRAAKSHRILVDFSVKMIYLHKGARWEFPFGWQGASRTAKKIEGKELVKLVPITYRGLPYRSENTSKLLEWHKSRESGPSAAPTQAKNRLLHRIATGDKKWMQYTILKVKIREFRPIVRRHHCLNRMCIWWVPLGTIYYVWAASTTNTYKIEAFWNTKNE